ncbi:hypothetical protein VTK56DRAFT_860 [Thermocarpiscus australiensis]
MDYESDPDVNTQLPEEEDRRLPTDKQLTTLALRVRTEKDPSSNGTISCTVERTSHEWGSNLVYKVRFSDGVAWAVLVPRAFVDGYSQWQYHRGEFRLRNAVRTMALVKYRTRIPVPSVIDFNSDYKNDINAPYMVLEFPRGQSAVQLWNDTTTGPWAADAGEKEIKRLNLLKSLAAYIDELNQFEYDQPPLEYLQGFLGECSDVTAEFSGDTDALRTAIRKFMLRTIESPQATLGKGPRFKRAAEFLSTLVDMRPFGELDNVRKPYVPAHGNLDLRDIMVHDDGTVSCILGWQNAGVVPRCAGNEAYPLWLTRDWDPCDQHSHYLRAVPGELARWRVEWLFILARNASSWEGRGVAELLAKYSVPVWSIRNACATDNFLEERAAAICARLLGGLAGLVSRESFLPREARGREEMDETNDYAFEVFGNMTEEQKIVLIEEFERKISLRG